ncbi:MAG: LptE family protein [Deferribacteres bacterium]|nr:LptE family protein [Deferribacteres bacterium]
MENETPGVTRKLSFFCACCLLLAVCLVAASCGYRMTGSRLLPFNSITIKPVINKTYEPGLEESLHNALAGEFINQGIEVRASGGDVELEATVTSFLLGAVGSVDGIVKEQEIIMTVDIKLTDNGRVTEFREMRSPIKITFQSTGTVSESAAHKETATDKASREIAKEIVSRVIMRYAK